MEEFCKHCGECCIIYKNCKTSDDIKTIRDKLIGDLYQYDVEPRESIDGKCEFLGENGCIIERLKRPSICLQYECSMLREYKSGNKNALKSLINMNKRNTKLY